MKWQYVLIVALAASIGGVAGSLATQHANAEGADDQQKIIEAVRHTGPSVVALDVVANGTRIAPANPLGMLLGQPENQKLVPFKERASGSGFVYDKSGLILTDDHVVHGAQKIVAIFENGDKAQATIFGEDPDNDIAVVKVNYNKLPPPLLLADSSKIQKGQWTIAIGEPLELQQTVTVGVASAIGRNEQITTDSGVQRSFKNLLQTSAPINPGNSGGPLINLEGEVIAINQSVAQPAQGIGFAVPSNTIKESIALIEKHPGANHQEAGFMGVQLVSVTDQVRNALHYKGNGVAVAGVISGSSAEQSGLKTGDVIQQINGKGVADAKQSIGVISAMSPGTVVHLRVWSKGNEHNVDVRLGARPIE